jgi:hypothetical protein
LNLIRIMPAKGQDRMQTSRYLARLMGPVMLAMAAVVLLNGAAFRVVVGQFLASYALIFIAGLFRILFPQIVVSVGGAVLAQAAALPAIGFGIAILGAVLSYFGYRPSH